MKKTILPNLILFLASLILALLLGEAVARIATRADSDGQAWLGKRALLPYRFPAERTRKRIERHLELEKAGKAYLTNDPLLGWTIRPDGVSEDKMYKANSRGIRSEPREYGLTPPPGTLRVALFGDSFTHGDEEPFEKTWGKFLEDELDEAGLQAQVLNFGVPGYGIGQAYLRWQYLGKVFKPKIAVFGYQAENMKRALNVFRQLYSRDTWLVFSKPRFILDPEGELGLVNHPTVPLEEVSDVIKDLPNHPLAPHEYWYNPKNYSTSLWSKSRLISLIYTFLTERRHRPGGRHDHRPGLHYWDPKGEATRVSLAILRRWAEEARKDGELPIVLHIPKKTVVECVASGEEPAHYYVLRELEKDGIIVVDPVGEMVGKHRLYKHSHFSSKGGRIVARVLADAILEILGEKGKPATTPTPAKQPAEL